MGHHETTAARLNAVMMAQLAEFEQQRRRTYPRWLPLPGLNIDPEELK